MPSRALPTEDAAATGSHGRPSVIPIEALVRHVGEGIARDRAEAAHRTGEESSAPAAMRVLVDAIVSGVRGGETPSMLRHSWTGEAPVLLAELRRGVLLRAADPSLPAASVLRLLQEIELLLSAIEEDVATAFVQDLIGPNALQLLVEVAHDVRSPLGSILLLVERMRRGGTGPVTPMQERHLGLVYSAAFGLSAMASDMMDLAHGGARLIGPKPIQFSMSALMHAVRDVVQPIAEEKSLGLRFSAPSRDIRVGQPAALTRVLLNLVTNALKFTNNGSVTVTAVDDGGDAVRFCVEDTGRGMPPAVMARVTSVFERAARTTAPAENGHSTGASAHSFSSAGLGIAICRKLLLVMGGALEFSPVQPVGTRAEFSLCLPPPTLAAHDAETHAA